MLLKDQMKKTERGTYDFSATSNDILLVKWNDNNVGMVATNHFFVELTKKHPDGQLRINVGSKLICHIQLFQYNNHMEGVDVLDQQIAAYRSRVRSKKWW